MSEFIPYHKIGGIGVKKLIFFFMGPKIFVESHTKTPRKSGLRVFQNPRWRRKWPPF